MKFRIYKIFFTIMTILAIIVTALIAIKYGKNQQYEKENQKAVETFSRDIELREQQFKNEWI